VKTNLEFNIPNGNEDLKIEDDRPFIIIDQYCCFYRAVAKNENLMVEEYPKEKLSDLKVIAWKYFDEIKEEIKSKLEEE